MKKHYVKIPIFFLLFLTGCNTASDKEFKDAIKMDFFYYRCNTNVVLGLYIKNVSDNNLHPNPFYSLDFILNGKVSPKLFEFGPLLQKVLISHNPKINYEYTNVENLIKKLTLGKNKLKWKYGDVFSNEIILEVTKNGEIDEIAIAFGTREIELGIASFGSDCGPTDLLQSKNYLKETG